MVASLPHAVRLKLEQALGQWRQWQCEPALPGAPHIDRILGGGHSNFNVLVAATDRQYVVRIDGVNTAANGINRQHEWRVLHAAAQAGIAPTPRYFNPELGALVCDYLPPDEDQGVDYADLAALLRSIHGLPVRHHRLDLATRLAAYDKQVERHHPQAMDLLLPHREAVRDQLAICAQAADDIVLCHNDLLRPNRIYSDGTLVALDWEYAAGASRWHELAAISEGDALTVSQTELLLEHYLERPATEQEWLCLRRHACVFRYLELAWYLAQETSHLGTEALESRAHRLAALVSALNA